MRFLLQNTALGDALGAGYEYVPQSQVNNFHVADGYAQHAKHVEVRPGMWTDDTMMSVAVADALLARSPGSTWSSHRGALADAMVEIHRQHYTKGYSSGMLAALDLAVEGGGGWALDDSFSEHGRSASNGAAMRSAVYGVLPNIEDAVSLAEIGAELTHSGLGVEGAVVVAMVSHYFIHQSGTREGLNDFLRDQHYPMYTTRMRERVTKNSGPLTFVSVTAALTAVRESISLVGVLEKSIRVGGDVDTVAAIAMALAGSCSDFADDLPGFPLVEKIQPVAGLTWDALGERDVKLRTLGGL